MLNSIQNIPSY